jgi:hypothetical protein
MDSGLGLRPPRNDRERGALTAADGEAWAAEVAALHARSRLFEAMGNGEVYTGVTDTPGVCSCHLEQRRLCLLAVIAT